MSIFNVKKQVTSVNFFSCLIIFFLCTVVVVVAATDDTSGDAAAAASINNVTISNELGKSKPWDHIKNDRKYLNDYKEKAVESESLSMALKDSAR